jgi:dienelactone hydrolase
MPGVRSRARIAALTTLGALAAAALGAVPAQAAEVTFTTADGLRISATYTPAGTGKAPAVILAHMFGGDRSQWALLVPQLRRAGIASLAYDIRGMGRSTTVRGGRAYRPPGASAYTNSMPRDVRAAVGWLRRRPDVDPSRIGIAGASVGAAIAYVSSGSGFGLRGAVAISPGRFPGSLDGTGVAGFRPRGVLFIADAAEIGASRSFAARTAAPKRVIQAPIAGHGTALLPDPTVRERIVAWLLARLRPAAAAQHAH